MSETVYRSISGSTAEDLFIELFCETFGAEKANYLYSQYHFYDIYQDDRYADFFLVNGGRRIAIDEYIAPKLTPRPLKLNSGVGEVEQWRRRS